MLYLACQRRDAAPEGDAVAKLVDEAGSEVRLRDVAARARHDGLRLRQPGRDLRLGPGTADRFRHIEQPAVQRLADARESGLALVSNNGSTADL
ncbi:hypothetical protein AB5I41_28145 [Sphingomonas sp. MMS24-JH45]